MRPLLYMRYLAVPARPAPLVFAVVFAFGLTLAARAGLPGVPLALILLSWLFKYAFVVLDSVSRGLHETPVVSIEMLNPLAEQRPLGVLIVAGAFWGATRFLEPYVGPSVTTGLRTTGLFLLPAFATVLGASGSVFEAANPVTLLRLIGRLRFEYLALLIVPGVAALVIFYLPSLDVPLVVSLVIAIYAVLATASMLGGVLYEKRDTLGIVTWTSPEQAEVRERVREERENLRELDEVYAQWRSGAHVRALQDLQTLLASHQNSLDTYRRYYHSLAAWPDQRLAANLGRELIVKLLAERHGSEALTIVRERLRADAEFRPANGAQLVRLVRIARDSGDRFVARALLADFEKHFPDDAAAPVVARLREGN